MFADISLEVSCCSGGIDETVIEPCCWMQMTRGVKTSLGTFLESDCMGELASF